MTAIKCVDSSAWLSYYFAENRIIREIVEQGNLLITSSLSLFEIKKRLLSLKKEPKKFLDFIKQRSQIVLVTATIAESAADFAIKKKLGAMDSLIFTTSHFHNAELITGDNDFRGLENVKIIS